MFGLKMLLTGAYNKTKMVAVKTREDGIVYKQVKMHFTKISDTKTHSKEKVAIEGIFIESESRKIINCRNIKGCLNIIINPNFLPKGFMLNKKYLIILFPN